MEEHLKKGIIKSSYLRVTLTLDFVHLTNSTWYQPAGPKYHHTPTYPVEAKPVLGTPAPREAILGTAVFFASPFLPFYSGIPFLPSQICTVDA